MRRMLLLSLMLLLVIASVSDAKQWRWPGETIIVTMDGERKPATGVTPRHNNTDEIIFEDDFEGTFTWTTHDLTADPGVWHISTYTPYGGSGRSWWCADPALGGYRDDWYMALDTPPVSLVGAVNPMLSFQSRHACEGIAGSTPPYDGWDGMNIRISTDNGATWTVLTNAQVEPDYDATSLYSFGYQHGEGPNIPGWAGQDTVWSEITANLQDYTGETVRIRFAFASDPNVSTITNPEWFAWQVDEIEVGRDGLYVLLGFCSGVLLPQVALEQGWDRDEFLRQVCAKACLPPDAWQRGAALYRFTAEVFAESK